MKSNYFIKGNIKSLAKYQKKIITCFGGNNIAKFINIQIIAGTLRLKLKLHGNTVLLISY